MHKKKFYLVFRIIAIIFFSSPLPLIGGQAHWVFAGDSLPLCPAGQEYDAGLCYPKCDAGYYGIGPVCWHVCPDGYTNDGALCRKDAIIVAKDSYGRGAGTTLGCAADEEQNVGLCYPKCKDGYDGVGPMCWQICPAGYTNTGLTCNRPADTITKDSYGRGVGTIPDNIINHTCPSGKEYSNGLCYKTCANGYYGDGPVCWQYCPAGYVSTGATCLRPSEDFLRSSYGRGAGTVLHACAPGTEQSGALCYPVCKTGYYGDGPVCWQTCPAGYTNDGALCRLDAIIIPKQSYGRGVGKTPDCDINNVACSGNFEVYNNFRPQPWGYSFANWGSDKYDASTDFDSGTMIRMFGKVVCQSGSSTDDCILTATARTWRDVQLASAEGGHCYGLAVSSQMFYANFDQAAIYQPTAAKTFDMDAGAKVRAHISEMFVSQSLSLADGSDSGWVRNKTPNDILDLVRANLRDAPNDPYVMAIFKTDANGKVTAGHAVTPFAIENRGNNVYWVHIYDNNKPNTDRYIVFDTAQNTWLYGFGSTNPADPEGAWKGDATSQTISLRLTSAHKLGGWTCPFCAKQTIAPESANNAFASPNVQFTLSGGGDLLIRDAQNHGVGWDFNAKVYVNEIAGAARSAIVGGAGSTIDTQITLPASTPATPLTAWVSGDGLTETRTIRVTMVGAGAALSVRDVLLAPAMHLLMTFAPDGRQIAFRADTTSAITPTIDLANDNNASGNDYLFDVSGITLAPSKAVTVSLDSNANALHFTDDTAQTNAYTVEMLRVTPQGQEQRYLTNQAVVSNNADAALIFGGWDGSGSISFSQNGQTQMLENQGSHKVFIPVVIKQ